MISPQVKFNITPLVSIVIPVYNGIKFIQKTAHNILQQSYDNFELLLINDGSTDDSMALLNKIADNDPRVKVYSKLNGGIASARNFGIDKATGEYVAFCDQDDFWNSEKLAKQIPLFRNHEIGLVYSRQIPHNHQYRQTSKLIPANKLRGEVFEQLIQENFISSISVIARKKLLLQVLCFDTDPQLMGVDDWHLWLKLALITKFDFVPENLTQHIIHGNNFSRNENLMHQAELVCLDKIQDLAKSMNKKINLHPIMNNVHYRYLKSYINDGDFSFAQATYKQIISNNPLQLSAYFGFLFLWTCPDKMLITIQVLKRKVI